jgi:hypothetical protein
MTRAELRAAMQELTQYLDDANDIRRRLAERGIHVSLDEVNAVMEEEIAFGEALDRHTKIIDGEKVVVPDDTADPWVLDQLYERVKHNLHVEQQRCRRRR